MSATESFQVTNDAPSLRQCPWCDSFDTVFHQRGYTGPTDEVNQYFTCMSCHRVTYELIAKSSREMRLGRFRAGGVFRDSANGTKYQVSRVLKVGLNEYLVYLKPLVESRSTGATGAAHHR